MKLEVYKETPILVYQSFFKRAFSTSEVASKIATGKIYYKIWASVQEKHRFPRSSHFYIMAYIEVKPS